MGGGAISAGMKTKIKAGEYQFPASEWKHISQEAKTLIERMLTVDPATRVKIDQIRQCSWLTGVVPETPINIVSMFRTEDFEQMRVSLYFIEKIMKFDYSINDLILFFSF